MLFKSLRARHPQRTHAMNIIKLENATPIHEVDACYLSFSIDISLIIGGQWWEGSQRSSRGLGTQRVPPLALNHPKLSQFVRHLSPAYLRVGGSEADTIHYFCADERHHDKEPELSEAIWNRLLDFIQQHDLKFMFTFKYGAFDKTM